MKSKLKILGQKEEYPCLKESFYGGTRVIVMFSTESSGMVVWSERVQQPVGYYSTHWVPRFFTPCKETIELSND